MLEFSLTYFICDCSSLLLPVFPGASVPGFFFWWRLLRGSLGVNPPRNPRAKEPWSMALCQNLPSMTLAQWNFSPHGCPLPFFQKPFAVALLPILFPFVFWLRPVLSATGRTTWKRTRALTVIWPARWTQRPQKTRTDQSDYFFQVTVVFHFDVGTPPGQDAFFPAVCGATFSTGNWSVKDLEL